MADIADDAIGIMIVVRLPAAGETDIKLVEPIFTGFPVPPEDQYTDSTGTNI